MVHRARKALGIIDQSECHDSRPELISVTELSNISGSSADQKYDEGKSGENERSDESYENEINYEEDDNVGDSSDENDDEYEKALNDDCDRLRLRLSAKLFDVALVSSAVEKIREVES